MADRTESNHPQTDEFSDSYFETAFEGLTRHFGSDEATSGFAVFERLANLDVAKGTHLIRVGDFGLFHDLVVQNYPGRQPEGERADTLREAIVRIGGLTRHYVFSMQSGLMIHESSELRVDTEGKAVFGDSSPVALTDRTSDLATLTRNEGLKHRQFFDFLVESIADNQDQDAIAGFMRDTEQFLSGGGIHTTPTVLPNVVNR